MSLTELRLRIINKGKGLLARIKYGVDYRYSRYDFLKEAQQVRHKIAKLTEHTLFQKIK